MLEAVAAKGVRLLQELGLLSAGLLENPRRLGPRSLHHAIRGWCRTDAARTNKGIPIAREIRATRLGDVETVGADRRPHLRRVCHQASHADNAYQEHDDGKQAKSCNRAPRWCCMPSRLNRRLRAIGGHDVNAHTHTQVEPDETSREGLRHRRGSLAHTLLGLWRAVNVWVLGKRGKKVLWRVYACVRTANEHDKLDDAN